MGTLTLIQGPQDPVVPLALAKQAMRVDTASTDMQIEMLIAAATERLDGRDGLLGRALAPQTWEMRFSQWPREGGSIVVQLPPLIQVTSVKYLDEDHAEQTLAMSVYDVINTGSARSFVRLASGQSWPDLASRPDAVRIIFDCGYVDDQSPANIATPNPIRQAIILMAQTWYDTPGREDIPEAVASLVAPFKIDRLGSAYVV